MDMDSGRLEIDSQLARELLQARLLEAGYLTEEE